MKSYQFFKFYKRFERKEKKKPYNSQWEKIGRCFITSCFMKPSKIINSFSSIGLFVHKILFFVASFLAA